MNSPTVVFPWNVRDRPGFFWTVAHGMFSLGTPVAYSLAIFIACCLSLLMEIPTKTSALRIIGPSKVASF